MDDAEHQAHVWDVAVLESTLKTSTQRLTVYVLIAVPAAIVGAVGLAQPRSGPIWGLGCLILSAIALSLALRQKAKRDYCRSQLEKIAMGESPANPPRSTG